VRQTQRPSLTPPSPGGRGGNPPCHSISSVCLPRRWFSPSPSGRGRVREAFDFPLALNSYLNCLIRAGQVAYLAIWSACDRCAAGRAYSSDCTASSQSSWLCDFCRNAPARAGHSYGQIRLPSRFPAMRRGDWRSSPGNPCNHR